MTSGHATERPPVIFFPYRLGKIGIMEGQERNPVLADDLALFPLKEIEGGKEYRVRFRAERLRPEG